MVRYNRVEQIVYQSVEPVIESYCLELVDVEFKKEGKSWFLRIFIDQAGGVGVEECQLISEKVSALLDEIDPISQSYYLEVSSPGIERPLNKIEHFIRFQGSKVQVNTYSLIKDRKKFVGIITGVNQEIIVLNLENDEKEIRIPFEQIAKAKLIYDFKN